MPDHLSESAEKDLATALASTPVRAVLSECAEVVTEFKAQKRELLEKYTAKAVESMQKKI